MTPAGAAAVVLGGGIAGLATAYFLTSRGYRPVVLEGSSTAGGLGTSIEHDGVQLDRFYHVLLNNDADLLGLIGDLGLGEQLIWRPTKMGFYAGERLYGLNSPLDLLRFSALPLADRVRTAWGALRATRLQRDPGHLDDVTAHEWLRRLFGPRVTDSIWGPLLRAKFGDAATSIPAYWVWSLLSREKNGTPEVKGYLRGGYQVLADRLCAAIRRGGGEVRLNQPIEHLKRDGQGFVIHSRGEQLRFDVAVSTLPLPILRRVTGGPLADELPLPDLRYQGVVNALVVSKQPLDRFYWTVVVDPRFGFQGVVETTHVIPPAWVGGRHLIYLMNYCDAASALYAQSDEAVRNQALKGLNVLYPRIRPEHIEAVYVFRAPHVEPVWSLGYLEKKPPFRVANSNFYLCTTAQAYPRVTAWNTSIALAREAVETICTDPRPFGREASAPAATRAVMA